MSEKHKGIYWEAFKRKDQVYDLSHLHPCTVAYLQPAEGGKPEKRYTVEVIYSLHCFTRRIKDKEDTDRTLHYGDYREIRIFDLLRYELSAQLPDIIATLIERQCYHTGHGNFFVIEITTQNGEVINYEVYFRVRRSGRSTVLYIESAYPSEQDSPSRKKKIAFHTILFNTVNNKPIKIPK